LVQFNAEGSSPSFCTFSGDPKSAAKVLIAQGVKIGKIHSLGEPCNAQIPGWKQVIFGQWRALGERAWREKTQNKYSSDFVSAFTQTILMDSHDDYCPAREDFRRRLSCQVEGASMGTEIPLQDLDPSVLTRLRISCHGRKFFVDENGAMGLAASESLEGDTVYVLLGAKVPYTFRPC